MSRTWGTGSAVVAAAVLAVAGCGGGATAVPSSGASSPRAAVASQTGSASSAGPASAGGNGAAPGSAAPGSPGPSAGAASSGASPSASGARTALTAEGVHEKGKSLAVLSLDVAARTATVEDARMMSGKEYCALKKLPATAEDCQDEYRIVYGTVKRTVKISPSAVYFVNFPEGACQGADFGCRVAASEFAATAKTQGPVLADAVYSGDEVVAIAQTYHP